MQYPPFEIRANFDRDTIVLYQAYRPDIAIPAAESNTFHPPFSMNRMTWLKPSFLWMMARSHWAQKSGQEHILAIRISRQHWEEALSQAVLTSPEKHVYPHQEEWRRQFTQAKIHVQWDPEYSIRGAKQNHRSIQVGISRHLIQDYVENWILNIEDITPLVRKMQSLRKKGSFQAARKQMPVERIYPLPADISRRLGMDVSSKKM